MKYRVRTTIRGDQQAAGESFLATDLNTPVLKVHEARLPCLLAIAATEGYLVYKTDMGQSFLYGSMENDVIYIRAHYWWPEPIPEGHCLKLLKSIYGTLQDLSRWHKHIWEWMEANGYPAVNSEKTIFMKHKGKHFIIHGLFVDDIMHIATNNMHKNKFMEKYSRDLNITREGFMKMFLGTEIKQSNRSVSRLSFTLISPGVILRPEDSPILQDPSKQKFYRSFVAKLQFVALWIRFNIAFALSQLA